MMMLARVHLRRNDLDACIAQCDTLLRVNAEHEEALMTKADILFLQERYDEATEKYEALLMSKPNNYAALVQLIVLLRRAGKLEEVQPFLSLAEHSNPRAESHAGLHHCKGVFYRAQHDVQKAVKHFNLARRDGKWGAPSLMHMIELYINPDNETLWDDQETEESAEAVRVAEKLLRELHGMTDPQSLKYRVLESYQLLATKQKANVDRAMHNFIEILETEKDYLPALLGMSTAFMLENSTTKARNALKRIAKMTYSHELADEFERGYLLLADIYIQKSKFDLAEDLCRRCLKYNKSCGKAWESMGVIKEKEHAYKDAAEYYEKAWQLEHKASAPIGFKLAFNYMKSKRYVEAIDVCCSVLRQFPDYPKIRKEILEKAMSALRP